jgi:hypothetical protein
MTKLASNVYELLTKVRNILLSEPKIKKYLNNVFLLKIDNSALPYLQINVEDIITSSTYSFDIIKIPTEYIIFYKFPDYSVFLNLLDEVKNILLTTKFNFTGNNIYAYFEKIYLHQSKNYVSLKMFFYMEIKNDTVSCN